MDKKIYFDAYLKKTHLIGRLSTLLILIMLLSAPFVYGWVLGTAPNLQAFFSALIQVIAVWATTGVVEFLVYAPLLGAGGSYLAFTTGNLINLKMPCVANSHEISGAKPGTPESEIIATLAIATSALTTTLVLAVGALLLIPLQPVLSNPLLKPAFDNVVPALFGALAYRYFVNYPKIAVLPLLFMSALFIAMPSLIRSVSMLIIPSGIIAIAIAWFWSKKEK